MTKEQNEWLYEAVMLILDLIVSKAEELDIVVHSFIRLLRRILFPPAKGLERGFHSFNVFSQMMKQQYKGQEPLTSRSIKREYDILKKNPHFLEYLVAWQEANRLNIATGKTVLQRQQTFQTFFKRAQEDVSCCILIYGNS